MKHHLQLLGHQVTDRVTKRKGVVVSISFDLSGCVQAYVQGEADKDGKATDGFWCDTKRLKQDSTKTVQPVSNFDVVPGGSNLPPHNEKS